MGLRVKPVRFNPTYYRDPDRRGTVMVADSPSQPQASAPSF